MGICAVVEYVTSWGLEQLFHRWVEKLPRQAVIWVSMGLAILFLMDTLMSLAGPNMGLGVQTFF